MFITLDLQAAPEPSRNPWNTRGQDGAKEAGVTRGVAALGERLDELRHTEANPKMERAEPEERNPTMAQETQRARAAAAGAAASASGGVFSKAAIPDAPKHASESRNDYELVLGRGQIASCLFAGTVVVAIFAGGAYFAGKLSAMNCVAAANSIPQAAAPLRVDSVVSQATGFTPTQAAAPVTAKAFSIAQQGFAPNRRRIGRDENGHRSVHAGGRRRDAGYYVKNDECSGTGSDRREQHFGDRAKGERRRDRGHAARRGRTQRVRRYS